MTSPSYRDSSHPAPQKRMSGLQLPTILHTASTVQPNVNFQPIPPPSATAPAQTSSSTSSNPSASSKLDLASPDRAMMDRTTSINVERMTEAETNFAPAVDYGFMPPPKQPTPETSTKRVQIDLTSSPPLVLATKDVPTKKVFGGSMPLKIPQPTSGSGTPERLRLLSSSPEASRASAEQHGHASAAGIGGSQRVVSSALAVHTNAAVPTLITLQQSSATASSGASPSSPHSPTDGSALLTPPTVPSPPPGTSPRASRSPGPASPKSAAVSKSPSPPPQLPAEPPLFSRMVAQQPPGAPDPTRPKLVSSQERDSKLDAHHGPARETFVGKPAAAQASITAPILVSSSSHPTSPSGSRNSSPLVAPKPSGISTLLLRNYAESVAVGKMSVVYLPMPPVPESSLERPLSPPAKGPLVPLMAASTAAGASTSAGSSSVSTTVSPGSTVSGGGTRASVSSPGITSSTIATLAAPASTSTAGSSHHSSPPSAIHPANPSSQSLSHSGSSIPTIASLVSRVTSGELMATAQRLHRESSPVSYQYLGEVPPLPHHSQAISPAHAQAQPQSQSGGSALSFRPAVSTHVVAVEYQPMPRIPADHYVNHPSHHSYIYRAPSPPMPTPYSVMPALTAVVPTNTSSSASSRTQSPTVSSVGSGTISPPGSKKNFTITKPIEAHAISSHRLSVTVPPAQLPHANEEGLKKDRIAKGKQH